MGPYVEKSPFVYCVFTRYFQYSPSCHFTDIFKANSSIWHRLCHLYRFINPRVTSCKFTEWWHWTELCKMIMFPQPLNWLIRLKTQVKGITLTPLGRNVQSCPPFPRNSDTMIMNKWSSGLLTRDKTPDALVLGYGGCDRWLADSHGRDDTRHTFRDHQHNDFCQILKRFFIHNLWQRFRTLTWLGRENSLALHHRILSDIFQFTPWSKRFVKD